MFSPHDSPAVNDWFRRFDAASRRLPAEERVSQREEIQQHLEGLVAAHEELGSSPEEAWEHALVQFGDPARIGRRLVREWRRSQDWVSPDMTAVLYTLAAQIVSVPILFFCTALVMVTFHLDDTSGNMFTVELFIGVPILAGAAVGKRFPNRALTGAFYAVIAWAFLLAVAIDYSALLSAMLLPATWLMLGCGSAYLASARKRRQWYSPHLADFTLRLPRKRIQTSR